MDFYIFNYKHLSIRNACERYIVGKYTIFIILKVTLLSKQVSKQNNSYKTFLLLLNNNGPTYTRNEFILVLTCMYWSKWNGNLHTTQTNSSHTLTSFITRISDNKLTPIPQQCTYRYSQITHDVCYLDY